MWDHIGVRDVPQAQDEYDCCIGGIFRLVTTGGTDDLADYLRQQASKPMGLDASKNPMFTTVAALRQVPIKL